MKGKARVMASEAVSRAAIYRFLSAIFLQPPGAELLRLLADQDFQRELALLFGADVASELGGVVTLGDFEAVLASLTQEYMDLFAVPTGRYVMPFEDVYRGAPVDGNGERGPLLGQRAVAARRLYRQAGAEVDRACPELPTHIGVELAFMGFLCETEAAAEKACCEAEAARARDVQAEFLEQHLTAWVPDLCQRIRTHAATSFYRGIADLTEVFVNGDAAVCVPLAHVAPLGHVPASAT